MTRPLKIGDCHLQADGLLSTPEGEKQLSQRHAAVLRTLLHAGGVAVGTAQLLDAYWGIGEGTPQNPTKTIFTLRKALASCSTVRIESVYGYGYRLRLESTIRDQPDLAQQARAICEETAHRVHDRGDVSLRAALSMYEMAAQLDPVCLQALLGFPEVKFQLIISGWETATVAWPAARGAIDDALELKPSCAEALAYRGLSECQFDWNYPASDTTFEIALDLAPTTLLVHDLAGRALLFRGGFGQAIDHLRHALTANPIAISTHGLLAYALSVRGEISAAKAEIVRAQQFDPVSPIWTSYASWIEAAHGDPAEACRRSADLEQQNPRSSVVVANRSLALARAGALPAARALLRTLSDRSRFEAPNCALTCVAWQELGETDTALRALEAAAEARDPWIGVMLTDPINEPLRQHPAFETVESAVFPPGS